MELVLPESGALTEISPALLASGKLPGLWTGDEISVQAVFDYFGGAKVVKVDRHGYQEPMRIPKASPEVVEAAIQTAVADGAVWLLSGPASILGEPIPAGVLSTTATLHAPPSAIPPAGILSETLPGAWKDGGASALSIATALSVKAGKTLPWKTVKDAIGSALQARFLELDAESQAWPCEFPSAQFIRLKAAAAVPQGGGGIPSGHASKLLVAEAELESSQIQDLGDVLPKLLELRTKYELPIRFKFRIEIGDGKTQPPAEAKQKANAVLKGVKDTLQLD